MDRLAKLDKDQLILRMRAAFERTMAEVTQSVNDAPDGHLINASEERCRDVLGEFRRLAYETAVQMRVEVTEADPSFSPANRVRHGLARRTVLTCCGRARVSRRRYASPAGGTDAPVDDLIDLAHDGVSLAVREMCCRIAIDSASFARAAANLDRVGQLKISDESLRKLVEGEGRAVLAWQDHEQLELDFDAGQCKTDQTPDRRVKSRVYVGIDGFMVPMVTDAEVGKRLAKAKARRKTLKRKRGVRRRPLVRRAGADQRYKEFKLVTMYDQSQAHKLMRVTRHGPDRAAKMLRGMAEDVRLRRADEVAAVTDGAEWIAGLIERNLPRGDKTTAILDFYHAAQHVHQTRRAVYGEHDDDDDDSEGARWADELIDMLLNKPHEAWWDQLVRTRAKFRRGSTELAEVRAPAKRAALDGLMQYLLSRRAKVDYARFRALGLMIGSGPTESACKSESRRLKGVGMRWTGPNAEAMTALESLHQSHVGPTYWTSRLKRAA